MNTSNGCADLADIGTSWIYGISKAHNNVFEYDNENGKTCIRYGGKLVDKENNGTIRTCRGTVPVSLLKPPRSLEDILPTDMGMQFYQMTLIIVTDLSL